MRGSQQCQELPPQDPQKVSWTQWGPALSGGCSQMPMQSAPGPGWGTDIYKIMASKLTMLKKRNFWGYIEDHWCVQKKDPSLISLIITWRRLQDLQTDWLAACTLGQIAKMAKLHKVIYGAKKVHACAPVPTWFCTTPSPVNPPSSLPLPHLSQVTGHKGMNTYIFSLFVVRSLLSSCELRNSWGTLFPTT